MPIPSSSVTEAGITKVWYENGNSLPLNSFKNKQANNDDDDNNYNKETTPPKKNNNRQQLTFFRLETE